ncbi:hypothetical protein ELE36_01920 [Pseudolysobacter antarcticus]|uniref:Uncharacterized protein n=1 Tax=Pseudolysobacter antarcticus TaxID=2511995 RepID=A0A411HFK4_9GAMM|nr:hypothetical protein [Pseudolysobacter antarcticus]QBB69234.1 hypothetical protein ELE36_01920 [Pseudolysobacter antarcticus]
MRKYALIWNLAALVATGVIIIPQLVAHSVQVSAMSILFPVAAFGLALAYVSGRVTQSWLGSLAWLINSAFILVFGFGIGIAVASSGSSTSYLLRIACMVVFLVFPALLNAFILYPNNRKRSAS